MRGKENKINKNKNFWGGDFILGFWVPLIPFTAPF